MEVIIKISDKDYNDLKANEKYIRAYGDKYLVMILDGTPLPKRHGDLIDVKKAFRKAHCQSVRKANYCYADCSEKCERYKE